MKLVSRARSQPLLVAIAAIFILFLGTVYFYSQALNNLAAGSCSVVNCPHQQIVQVQNVIIVILLAVIGVLVAWIYVQSQNKQAGQVKPVETGARTNAAATIDFSSLEQEEQKIVSVLNDSGGSAFQSDLIKNTGYGKVKVSRILDKLEHKGFLERKRRGMTNIIVLK